MDNFWAIIDPQDDGVIQYLAVLTPKEIDAIKANGYTVVSHAFSKKVYPWLKEGTTW